MKAKFLPLILLGASCYLPETDGEMLSRGLSPKKQRQKISSLQKKLEVAEIDELKAKEQVDTLRSEIEQAELSLVRKTIRNVENTLFQLQDDPNGSEKKKLVDVAALFVQEREILQRLIESGPTPAAFAAQVLLDQVLRMITNLSDTY